MISQICLGDEKDAEAGAKRVRKKEIEEEEGRKRGGREAE